jgi:hypothetical protein
MEAHLRVCLSLDLRVHSGSEEPLREFSVRGARSEDRSPVGLAPMSLPVFVPFSGPILRRSRESLQRPARARRDRRAPVGAGQEATKVHHLFDGFAPPPRDPRGPRSRAMRPGAAPVRTTPICRFTRGRQRRPRSSRRAAADRSRWIRLGVTVSREPVAGLLARLSHSMPARRPRGRPRRCGPPRRSDASSSSPPQRAVRLSSRSRARAPITMALQAPAAASLHERACASQARGEYSGRMAGGEALVI